MYLRFILRLVKVAECPPLGKGCSLGYPYHLFVSCIFVVFVISHFSFEDRNLILIVLVPVHCLLFTLFFSYTLSKIPNATGGVFDISQK